MSRIEQLHYGWVERGVDGANRFQIAAMSRGLRVGPLAAVLPVAKKICRYDAPRRPEAGSPISYGWFDQRGVRIAFCRRPLQPSRGRRGDFAAHVLVGDAEAMPELRLARLFESPFWWDGRPSPNDTARGQRWEFLLPALELDELPLASATELTSHEDTAVLNLAHALLALPEDGRIAVSQESLTFGRCIRAIADFCPEAFSGTSLSTYEGAPTFPFRVLASLSPQPGRRTVDPRSPAPAGLARSAVERLRSEHDGEPTFRTAVGATLAGSDCQSRGSRLAFLEKAEAVAGVAEGLDVAIPAPTLLRAPELIVYLARTPGGQSAIAEGLCNGMELVRETLESTRGVVTDQRVALAGALVARYRVSDALKGCAAAARSIGTDSQAAYEIVLNGCLDAALEAPGRMEDVLDEDVRVLLAHAARSHSASEVGELLKRASAFGATLARERDIPDSYAVAIVRAMAANGAADSSTLPEMLEARPDLLDGVSLTEEERASLLGRLRTLPPKSVAKGLMALLPALASKDTRAGLEELLTLLTPGTVAEILRRGLARCRGESAEIVSEMCADFAAQVLEMKVRPELSRPPYLVLAVRLLETSGMEEHCDALALLRRLEAGAKGEALAVVGRAGAIRDPRLREAVIGAAMHVAVRSIDAVEDVQDVWQTINTAWADTPQDVLLARLLGTGVGHASSWGSELLLAWTALCYLTDVAGAISGTGRLKGPELHGLTAALADRVAYDRFAEWDPYLADVDRRIRSWWSGLAEESRRRARSPRPLSRRLLAFRR